MIYNENNMIHPNIYPVILANNSNFDLWPLSRKGLSKQFANLVNGASIFSSILENFITSGFNKPIFVSNDENRFNVIDQAISVGINDCKIFVEPESKGLAASILAAAIMINEVDKDAILLISPSDLKLRDTNILSNICHYHESKITAGEVIWLFSETFNSFENGNYITHSTIHDGANIDNFINSKQNSGKSKANVSDDKLLANLRNTNIYLCTAKALIYYYKKFAPILFEHISEIIYNIEVDNQFLRPDRRMWNSIEAVEFSSQILANSNKIQRLIVNCGVQTLDNWNELWKLEPNIENQPTQANNIFSLDCENSYFQVTSPDIDLIGIGLSDISVIATPETIVISKKSESNRIAEAAKEIRAKRKPDLFKNAKINRFWGWDEVIARGKNYEIKKVCINPGKSLSYHSHTHRSEKWTVIEGNVQVTINGEISTIKQEDTILIPKNAIHKIENTKSKPAILIEIKTGRNLGDDDIKRFKE